MYKLKIGFVWKLQPNASFHSHYQARSHGGHSETMTEFFCDPHILFCSAIFLLKHRVKISPP